jgi:transcriptional regulator with XRE-family HTH domain
MKDFREKIKNKRLLLGLSRDRLAMMSGVTPKTIHTIEEGDTLPSLRILTKICKALDLEITVTDKGEGKKFNADEVSIIVEAAISKVMGT